MNKLRRILVAIKNPASRRQPALRKAAQLAQASGATLELFHAISDPVFLDAFLMQGLTLQQGQRQQRERMLAKLEKLAAPLRQSGLPVQVQCDWDYPAYEAIIRRAVRGRAGLIVAERHARRHVLPWLLRFNDWELLRRSPLPVLLVKQEKPWRAPAVLAAIDPSHGFAKPARLDAQILDAASTMATVLGGTLHVAHAFAGVSLLGATLDPVPTATAETIERQAVREARKAFVDSVERSPARGARRHFVTGQAVDLIPLLVRRQRIGLVVMGAVSRSGLQRLVIGDTAEQVLDSLPCDALVVKPASFKSRVRSRGRGVQLVPTPSYT
jgi:universal stress protein E